MKKNFAGMLFCLMTVVLICSGAMADSVVSQVTVRQRWPWSRLVDIDYVLSGATQQVDIEMSAFNGTNPLSLPDFSLSGDRYNVSDGAHRIVWDPTATAYTNMGVLGQFNVALTATPAPLYMIVDLTKSPGDAEQIEYIYSDDERLETTGKWTNIWLSVTNDSVCATTKLVLKRITAGSFLMGDTVPPTIPVTLSKSFYAGVFEVTEAQWDKIMNNGTSSSRLPQGNVSYDLIRGATTHTPSINWPTTGMDVSSSSFLGKLRDLTGLSQFDLPTESQWEYFCRAGTETYFNDGIDGSSSTQLNILGWWSSNSGMTSHPVGLKQANVWGLFDVHGNENEWCRDWYQGTFAGSVDPSGPATGGNRIRRGGNSHADSQWCRCGVRLSSTPNTLSPQNGFRIILSQ